MPAVQDNKDFNSHYESYNLHKHTHTYTWINIEINGSASQLSLTKVSYKEMPNILSFRNIKQLGENYDNYMDSIITWDMTWTAMPLIYQFISKSKH